MQSTDGSANQLAATNHFDTATIANLTRRNKEEGPTAVYRFYDIDDTLLYVGITSDLRYRWQQHRESKNWWPSIYRASVVWLNTRKDALKEESAAIQSEAPVYNGSPGRPRVGRATIIRLGPELTARVDAARQDGESRAAAIRRLLSDALA